MKSLDQSIEDTNSKEGFLLFMEALINDLRNNPSSWENITLVDYLSAIHSWTEDMEGYYKNNQLAIPENVNWRFFADIFMAAKMYE